MGNSRLNAIYLGMKYRCCNPSDKRYKNYGAKGISVCKEWLNSERIEHAPNITKGWISFRKWALANGYSDNLTLDRIDNKKGYSPQNCRWVDMKTQQNNRSNNHLVTYNGKTQTLAQWCDELKLNRPSITSRIVTMGWTVERAFTEEIKKKKLISFNGKEQTLSDWCSELKLNFARVYARIYKLHWSVERAFLGEGVES